MMSDVLWGLQGSSRQTRAGAVDLNDSSGSRSNCQPKARRRPNLTPWLPKRICSRSHALGLSCIE